MRLFDLTLPSPAENLAMDEALLDEAEENGASSLRFWESPVYFVVVGYGNHREREADLEVCAKAGVPVLRRCSGGGTVLQGPGCLNYNLVLPFDHHSALESITGTNNFVMETNRRAVEQLLGERVEVQGHSDLTLRNLKFSGNAQRRKRRALVFHGTFLCRFDLTTIPRFLKMPSLKPDYREDRPHEAFVLNLPASQAAVKEAIAAAWKASTVVDKPPMARMRRLLEEKYSKSDWHERF